MKTPAYTYQGDAAALANFPTLFQDFGPQSGGILSKSPRTVAGMTGALLDAAANQVNVTVSQSAGNIVVRDGANALLATITPQPIPAFGSL